MPDFHYTALDASGHEITGGMDGRDKMDAAQKIRALGYYPISVNPTGNAAARTNQANKKSNVAADTKKVNRMATLLFTRELADLIEAGLPIDRALTVLIEQTDNVPLQHLISKLQDEVRAGNPLSSALTSFPKQFPILYTNMIRAGEVAGQLPDVMTRLADFLEKEQVRKSQLVAAMTYPMVLIVVAISAVTGLLTFVIPRLQSVFKDLGSALPVPTQILLGVSGFISQYWWVIIGFIIACVVAWRLWSRTSTGQKTIDQVRLTLPILGPITVKIVMARFTRTLGTLLAGGVPILDSLEISSSAVGNSLTSKAIESAKDRVRQGETLASSLRETAGFLPLIVHMTAVGEETGRLSLLLIRTANTLDLEIDTALRRLTSLVEPLVVLFMGGFVGFIVLSILLPIFQADTIVK